MQLNLRVTLLDLQVAGLQGCAITLGPESFWRCRDVRSEIRSNDRAGGVLGEDSSGLAPDYKGLPAPICHTVPDTGVLS